MTLYRDVRRKPQGPAWIPSDREESDRDAGGKTLQAKFPPQVGLPSPFLATFANKNYPKKKYTIQSAEAWAKLIAAPTPSRGKAWAGDQQDGLAPREGRGTRPGRTPPDQAKLPPQRSRCLRPWALPGTRPWGWTKDATGTPGRGGAPVAGADNGLVEGWGRGWQETRGPRGGARPVARPRRRPPSTYPRGGVRVGFQPHLKSLSLDVIFSSKLEMWYEALAMLPASIPPAGLVAAGPRGRGSSSRWRRRPLPGSQRDAD